MKTITVGFSKSSLKFAPFSWLIIAATKSMFSHAYLHHHDEEIDREVYFQASHSLVNEMSQNAFLAEETVVEEFEFEVSDVNYHKIKSFCYDQLGKPYAVKEIFGLALVLFLRIFGIRIKNPVNSGLSQFFCSGLIALLLSECEAVKLTAEIQDITPADLYPIVKVLPRKLY